MKVAHVRDVANVASTLVEGLKAIGHQAELIPVRAAGAPYPLPLKALFLPQRLREAAAINRYLREQAFDVVHLHVAYMGWLGMLGRYPYFLHCHGIDLYCNLYHPLLRWLTAKALRGARRVYYSTPDLLAHAARVRPDAVFIPNPIDTDRFRPLPKSEGDTPRLLLISRLDEIKGPEVAFAAIVDLKRRRPDVQVDAFALGSLVARYRHRAAVNFIPPVPYSDMPTLINRYDVVIGQFRLGIMSMSELESMACGKPVVSYFSYPHFYDEPPPLYSTMDVAAAVEQMLTLLENPQLRREAGERGREWVVKRHDYRQVAGMLATEYETYGAASTQH